jgi:nitrate reductase NapAB chaperone NapD
LSTQTQHYSGLLVTCLPGNFDACISALEEVAGVTVSIRDPERDRMIVVLEAPSRDLLEKLHRRVGSLPEVVMASPLVHVVDDPSRDAAPGCDVPSEPR